MAASDKSYADQIIEILEKEVITSSIPLPAGLMPGPLWDFATLLCLCGVSRQAVSKLVAVSTVADLRPEGETFQDAIRHTVNMAADELVMFAKMCGLSKNLAVWAHVKRSAAESKDVEEIHKASGEACTVAEFHKNAQSKILSLPDGKLTEMLNLFQVSLQPISASHHQRRANLLHHVHRTIIVMSMAKQTGRLSTSGGAGLKDV